jgi:NAD(P)-dependent dehydrogenase (short-subunit alcohol dehydrogenase family)
VLENFEGKVAVVTGAASGIGRALATKFAEEGMMLVLADIEASSLGEVARAFEAQGVDVLSLRTDVTQADDLSALAEATIERFGAVHVLCNNAGVFVGGLSWEASQTDWDWVFGVNVFGIIHGIRAFVPIMLEQNEPSHIVNTVSMAGLINTPFSGPYNMSKHAAMSLTETLFHEMQARQSPIGVSALCPELVRTAISRSERNRPEHLKRPDGPPSPILEMLESAIHDGVSSGVDPAMMAERVVNGIRTDQFYLMADEGTSWDLACRKRLEDIRLRRNPNFEQNVGAN